MKSKIHFSRKWALALAGGLLVPLSGISAPTFQVQATVAEVCVLGVHTDVDFGTLDFVTDPAQITGAVQWKCTPGSSADVALNDGVNGTRLMEEGGAGTDTIAYDLYHTDYGSNGGTRWGTGVEDLTVGPDADGMGTWESETVYAEMALADYENAAPLSYPATYSDTITVTISVN